MRRFNSLYEYTQLRQAEGSEVKPTYPTTTQPKPDWVSKIPHKGAPPEISNQSEDAYRDARSRGGAKRNSAPGFACTQNQLDNGYIWFHAVRGDDASRAPALVKPYTFFRTSPTSNVIRVPVTTLNMVYRDAAMLAKRSKPALIHTYLGELHYRDGDTKNENVWYYRSAFDDVWVGVTLHHLLSYGPLDYVPRNSGSLPIITWNNQTAPKRAYRC